MLGVWRAAVVVAVPFAVRQCDGWTRGGAIYGLRNPGGGLPVRTPVRNLVLAGAMTLGGGIEPSALSGVFAAKALVADVLEATGMTVPARQEDLADAV